MVLAAKAPDTGKLTTCPEIVIEIVSSGAENRRRDYEAKRALYRDRGAREYWIIDPEEHAVHVLVRAGGDFREVVLRGGERLTTPLVPAWTGMAIDELL